MPASAKTVILVLQENFGLLADAELWLFSVPRGLTGGRGCWDVQLAPSGEKPQPAIP